MSDHLLLYEYVEDMGARRAPHRDAHLAHLRAAREAGQIVLAGAFGAPLPDDAEFTPRGGAIVFHDTAPEEIERFVREDPYMQAGLITSWRVHPYVLV